MSYLKIIIGPMYSGKTSELINDYNKLKLSLSNNCEKKYKYDNTLSLIAIDFKEEIDNITFKNIYNHNNDYIEGVFTHNLNNITEFILENNIKYIFINEAQFFKDLKSWTIMMLEKYKKHIIICGLDSDFKQEKFGEIMDIIPHANIIVKKTGKCNFCEQNSLFSYKTEKNLTVIDMDYKKYLPTCRECYYILNKKL